MEGKEITRSLNNKSNLILTVVKTGQRFQILYGTV